MSPSLHCSDVVVSMLRVQQRQGQACIMTVSVATTLAVAALAYTCTNLGCDSQQHMGLKKSCVGQWPALFVTCGSGAVSYHSILLVCIVCTAYAPRYTLDMALVKAKNINISCSAVQACCSQDLSGVLYSVQLPAYCCCMPRRHHADLYWCHKCVSAHNSG